MLIADALYYVRRDIGDPAVNFFTTSLCDGLTLLFDLPQQNINTSGLLVQYQQVNDPQFVVLSQNTAYTAYNPNTVYNNTVNPVLVSYAGYYYHLQGSFNETIPPPSTQNQTNNWWIPDIVYSIDDVAGKITTSAAIVNNATLIVTGEAWGMFTDTELTDIVYTAVRKHCQGQIITQRYRTQQGFITYRDVPKDLDSLPKEEEQLVVTLSDIECMYILATDSAIDVTIQTSEGTVVDRSARYQQIMTHINALWDWYNLQCSEWNVGMLRMESLTQRRVSRTTGRYVPIFREREYDDHRYPERQLPQIDRRDTDVSGVPSPIWNGSPM